MAVMSSSASGEVCVTLPRDGSREPFGFRLRGGSDLKEAFIIQRVRIFLFFSFRRLHLDSGAKSWHKAAAVRTLLRWI